MKPRDLKTKITFIFLFVLASFIYVFSSVSAITLAQKLVGRILLQVESKGEAWYVDSASLKRIYLADGNSAYDLMRNKGLGIKNLDLAKIPVGFTSDSEIKEIPGWKIYQNNTLGLQIQYPKEWMIPSSIKESEGVVSLKLNHGLDLADLFIDGGDEVIFIHRYLNIPDSLDLWYREKSEFTEENIQASVENWNNPSLGYSATSREEFVFERYISASISGVPAIVEYKRGPIAYSTVKKLKYIRTEKNYYVKVGDDIYYINAFSYSGEDMNVVMQKFNAIISTIQFQQYDLDFDGLSNKLEESLKTDPNNPDTDNDGHKDGAEVLSGYNPMGTGTMPKDQRLINRFKGKILLQVESRGEAWYVHPINGKRYYMPTGDDAYQIMKYLSLGVKNSDLYAILLDSDAWQLYSLDSLDFSIRLPRGFKVRNPGLVGGNYFSEILHILGSEIKKIQGEETVIDYEDIQFSKYKKEGDESLEQVFIRTWNSQEYYNKKSIKLAGINAQEYTLKPEYNSGPMVPKIFVFGTDQFVYVTLIRNFESSMYIDILNTIQF